MIGSRIDTRLANLIIKQHDKDRPAAGVAYDEWVATTAEKFNVSEKQVKTCVAREAEAYSLSLRASYATHSQKLAHLMGLTMVETIETIARGLTATKKEVLKGPGGTSLLDENGDPVVFEQPDNRAQADFAKLGVSLHGMNAPELVQMDVNHKVDMPELPKEEIAKIVFEASRLLGGGFIPTGGSADVAGSNPGVNGARGAKEPAVLDAELHQDGR